MEWCSQAYIAIGQVIDPFIELQNVLCKNAPNVQ